MCGITGLVSLQGAPIDPAVLQRMTDRQAHRGPDGKCWIVFNGEIYNHRELRTELEGRGYTFGTRTDTEVLLQAYREWGEDCLERLQGMYAFAIWDGARRCLFAARDRLGIKPFYYATPGGTFAFASEMKSLLVCPGLDTATDDDAVVGFLIHANCDYGERTLLGAVKALPAGYCLTVHATTGRVDVRQYWQLTPAHANGVHDSVRLDGLRTLLASTMQSHLMSDVRAGSCLSGGIDSSTVVSLIGKLRREQPDQTTALGDRFLTFTSCWKYPELDERTYADAVARSADAESHLVFPSAEDFWETFPLMAWHQDMPFASISYYAQWSVMRAARDAGVKVLLDGQGGDEVFGGYAKFRYAYLMSLLRTGKWGRMTLEAGHMVRQGDLYVLDLRRGYRYLPGSLRRLLGVDALLEGALQTDFRQAVSAESTPATRWWRYASDAAKSDNGWTMMQRIQVDDLMVDTLPQLLRMEDRSSMAFSLEARVPLLDHHVVEYGVSLPDRLKIRNGWSKFAMREAVQGIIPDVVRQRKTKLGFAVPGRQWLTKELRPQVSALIEDSLRSAKYVDPDVVRRWYRASPDGATARSAEAYLGLFRLLSLEMWMRAFSLS